jgi:hypothetical protein
MSEITAELSYFTELSGTCKTLGPLGATETKQWSLKRLNQRLYKDGHAHACSGVAHLSSATNPSYLRPARWMNSGSQFTRAATVTRPICDGPQRHPQKSLWQYVR